MLLACALAVLATDPGGAAPRWTNLAATVFHNYGRNEGLPHPVPTALAQDRDGFIWIGTQGGLTRWDGYRFRVYKADPATAGSLPDDWVQTLHVDPVGRLWIGGGAGGLARYDPVRDRFLQVPIGRNQARTHIGAIADDGRGGLWVGTDQGLHHLDPATGTVRATAIAIADAPVRALLRDRRGALWVGTTRGLARRSAGSAGWTTVAFDHEPTSITALFEDPGGRVWIGTQRRGLFVVDTPGAQPRAVGTDPILTEGSVSSISPANPREIWVGLRGNGIAAVEVATRQLRFIRHDRTVASSLAHDDVWALMRDDAGSMWVGSIGGLSYHPRNSGLISAVLASQDRAGGLSSTDPLAVLATRDGRVWMGYLAGGVDVIDPAAGRVAALRPGNGRHPATTLPPDIVFAMAEDDRGGVYIGTRRGLYRTGPAADGVRLVPLPGLDPQVSITALSFDDGILWVGSDEEGLIGMVPDRAGQVGRVVFGKKDSAALTDDGVNVILRGNGRDLWVGARNGLYRVDKTTHAVDHIEANPADPTALPGRNVVATLIDRRGRLWAGTFGGGLAMMTGRDAAGRWHFRRIGVADGLPHMNVDSLQMDGSGIIWAGTDDGLARIDPDDLAVRAVRQADGSALVDYYAGAGATTAAGEAVFGAKGGLTVVRPGPLPRWTLQPPLVVTDLRIGGVPQPAARLNRPDPIAPLMVKPDSNSIAVEFAALDYTAPERNRYSYRLDGFDRDWTETDANRRLAIYTNLPPGDYVLRLRGSNRAGIWAERELALPIRVLPAWYQRLWLKLAGGLLLLLAVFAIVRWRTQYLRKRQGDLERQVADRTADLRAANARLGHLAQTDPLTGCANRRHFMTQADERIHAARRGGRPLCLAVLDLDDFKSINDRHGHPGGDAVLEMAGVVLVDHLREGDIAGRIGGEEFAILMPDTAIADARHLADQLREAIGGARIKVDGVSIGVSASIGVAELDADEDFGRLYARADAVLYTAKHAGRNRVETAAPAA
ncbi:MULTISPECIES: ligand-binding sensor domain-containing protein [unclassified Sphingomonas]|uniref:ligand-binding sensor domain-containing protein n=1 Tax=unclassified Sphingomonas TaxID=196159 RepID=UPI00070219ED|nr:MULTISPECIES: ligand-binding sensor domain-containing diguanylate cyclase [unclassified Sphingomonas]KQX26156.1 diguanylate cyclase [Sphingomonas sp. Root1294]KQY69223.1 diguanylate cyclase [Sphingomonas sp. Root50]KRB89479.1 diguanylate cyclase [Sphingomonas sp. Root720]